jgi:hypothetical protein
MILGAWRKAYAFQKKQFLPVALDSQVPFAIEFLKSFIII